MRVQRRVRAALIGAATAAAAAAVIIVIAAASVSAGAPKSHPDTTTTMDDCDVLVAGGSAASVATALSAAAVAPKLQICLTDPTDWPGGQLTASGVSAIDYGQLNRLAQNQPASFKSLVGFVGNPGGCWVSLNCFAPGALAEGWIQPQLAAAGNIRFMPRTVVRASGRRADGSVAWVQLVQRTFIGEGSEWQQPLSATLADWYSPSPSAMFNKESINVTLSRGGVVVEATEFGDVLMTSGVSAVAQGVEVPEETSTQLDSTCGQATTITYYMAVSNDTSPPSPTVPKGGDAGIPFSASVRADLPYNKIWTYRRSLAVGNRSAYAVNVGDVTQQNYANDLDSAYLFTDLDDARAAASKGEWAGGVNITSLTSAEQRAYGSFWWYRDVFAAGDPLAKRMVMVYDGGAGGAGTTANGLSKMPYLRDTRRSVGIDGFRLTYPPLNGVSPDEAAISGDRTTKRRPQSPAVSSSYGYRFPDTVALVNYAVDIHRLANTSCVLPKYTEQPDGAVLPSKPSYVPFRALTNRDAPNMLVAGKTMAQTFLANSVTRLHPCEWTTGVAAGAAAAMMVTRGYNSTRDVYDNIGDLQAMLQAAPLKQPLDWSSGDADLAPAAALGTRDASPPGAGDAQSSTSAGTLHFGAPVLVAEGPARQDASEFTWIRASDGTRAYMGGVNDRLFASRAPATAGSWVESTTPGVDGPPGAMWSGDEHRATLYSFGSITSAFVNATTHYQSDWAIQYGAPPAAGQPAATTKVANRSVTVGGFPSPIISLRFSSGDVATTSWGTVASAVVWRSADPPPVASPGTSTPSSPDLTCCGLSIDLVRMTAPGQWSYVSTIAPYSFAGSEEGPNENALVELQNKSLLCVFRVDGGDGDPDHPHKPYATARSDDGGKTWVDLQSLGPAVGSARPRMAALANGVLVLAGGRPLLNLWVSYDGSGSPGSWTAYNLPGLHNVAETNATLRYCPEFASGQPHNWTQSTCYTSVVPMDEPDQALVCYDRYGRGSGGYSGKMPPDCQVPLASVFCSVVTVTPP